MIWENKSYHLVEFENRRQAAHKKSSERIELLKATDHDLPWCRQSNIMMTFEQINIIIQVQVFRSFVRFLEFLVDFPYDFICNHTGIRTQDDAFNYYNNPKGIVFREKSIFLFRPYSLSYLSSEHLKTYPEIYD